MIDQRAVSQIGESLVGPHRVCGLVVGVVDKDEISVRAFGESGTADVPQLDGDSVFDPGSVAKTLTATVLADMVIHGDVALDDPIHRFLADPGLVNVQASEITLGQLATHFSGLPREPRFGRESEANLYRSLASVSLHAPPGERFRYSNFGFALLALALARRAGMDFSDVLANRVFAPLGMTSTGVRTRMPDVRPVQGFVGASRHAATPKVQVPGAGGLWTTANDMLIWVKANLWPERTPIEVALRLAHEPRRTHWKIVALKPGHGTIGLAWALNDDGVIFHGGGTPGFTAYCGFNRSASRGLVVLTNFGVGAVPPLRNIPWTLISIVRLIRGVSKLMAALTADAKQ